MANYKIMNNVHTKSIMKIEGPAELTEQHQLKFTTKDGREPTLSQPIVEFQQNGSDIYAKDEQGVVYTNSEKSYELLTRKLHERDNPPQIDDIPTNYKNELAQAQIRQIALSKIHKLQERWEQDNKELPPKPEQTRDIKSAELYYVHRTWGKQTPISPQQLELIVNLPKDFFAPIPGAEAMGILEDYLRSRFTTIENWNDIMNRYGLTMTDLTEGPCVIMKATYTNDPSHVRDINMSYVKGVTIDPGTGYYDISSRTRCFRNNDPASKHRIAQFISWYKEDAVYREVNKIERQILARDPEQARLESFSRDKYSMHKTIEISPDYHTDFALIREDGTYIDKVDPRVIGVLATGMNRHVEDLSKEQYSSWQWDLARSGMTKADFLTCAEQLGLSTEEIFRGLTVEVTGVVANEKLEYSLESFTVPIEKFKVDRTTGEFSFFGSKTSFVGREGYLADMSHIPMKEFAQHQHDAAMKEYNREHSWWHSVLERF